MEIFALIFEENDMIDEDVTQAKRGLWKRRSAKKVVLYVNA